MNDIDLYVKTWPMLPDSHGNRFVAQVELPLGHAYQCYGATSDEATQRATAAFWERAYLIERDLMKRWQCLAVFFGGVAIVALATLVLVVIGWW